MENGLITIETTPNQHKISAAIKAFSAEEIAIIKSTVAKDTTDMELTYFLMMSKSLGLNPFNKEIWCYKQKDQLLIFAGRDGFLTAAQKNPLFNGLRSSYVCKNDEFELDIPMNQIHHKIKNTERGEIVGAYAIAFRKEGEPTIVWVDFKTFNKGYNAWKSHPGEMIVKVAEAQALKKAFGLNGLEAAEQYDFDRKTFANPIQIPEAAITNIDDVNSEAEALKLYSLGKITKAGLDTMVLKFRTPKAA